MSSPDFVFLPSDVLPGQTVNLSLNLIAPEAAGKYQGNWQFEASNGKIFGVGNSFDQPFWVRIRVITPSINTITSTPTIPSPTSLPSLTPTPVLPIAYDFVANACVAQWQSNHGMLMCPGHDKDANGFVLILNQAQLEDGAIANLPALLTSPGFSNDGFIQGTYPDYQVQAGDHLQSSASCENGATNCSVLFKVSYVDSLGEKNDLWAVGEFYDGQHSSVDLDLTSLAGKTVKFVFNVSALGSPIDDRALWIGPHIVHLAASTPTVTATATPTYSSPMPTVTPTYTLTPVSTVLPHITPTPTVSQEPPVPSPSIVEIINQIISFFQRLLGR